MRYLFAAVLAMAMAIPSGRAYAQMSINSSQKDPLTLKYEREENERKDNEKAYNDTMKRLKGQPPAATKSDPWAKMRPANDSTVKR